jgi:hypothetical protein
MLSVEVVQNLARKGSLTILIVRSSKTSLVCPIRAQLPWIGGFTLARRIIKPRIALSLLGLSTAARHFP